MANCLFYAIFHDRNLMQTNSLEKLIQVLVSVVSGTKVARTRKHMAGKI